MFGFQTKPKDKEMYFIECRNFHKSSRGLVAALITETSTSSYVQAKLILTEGLIYDEKKETFDISYYELRNGQDFKSFLENKDNSQQVHKYFDRKNALQRQDIKLYISIH